jgi:hypothetical protein
VNQEIKRQWTEALRSGRFPQGKDRLEELRYARSEDAPGGERGKVTSRYCCLGVLCQLAVDAGVVERFVTDTSTGPGWVHYGRNHEQYYLPPEVVRWAELEGTLGDRHHHRQDVMVNGTGLSHLNDEEVPFAAIADLIEENL